MLPVGDQPGVLPGRPAQAAAQSAWDRALELGEEHGYRNAQTTLLAPTGTIGLLMDCDTTGVEPDFALVKFKKLAGGGYFKIANQSHRRRRCATSATARSRSTTIVRLRARHADTRRRAAHQPRVADGQGLHRRRARQDREGAAGRLRARRSPSTSGRSARTRCAGSALTIAEQSSQPGFDLLRALGFTRAADRRGQRGHLRHDDGRGRAAPEGRAPAGLRLRQQLRQEGHSASSTTWATSG